MIGNLEPESEVPVFLSEVHRVVVSGGIVRLALPDLERRVKRYLETQDADEFVASLHIADATPCGFFRVRGSCL